MKRKLSNLDEEESRFSNLLFNKSKDLAEKLILPGNDNEQNCKTCKVAWVDEDDETFDASIIPNTKSKTLYTEKLKQKYETLIGTPNWANLNRISKDEEDEEEKILRTVGHLKKTKTIGLPNKFLEVKYMPKINSETENEGPIISRIEFHPKIAVSLVAGQAGNVSLFTIGSDFNNKLHTFKLKKWSIHFAYFTPDGSEAIIASKKSNKFCVYNLVKAEPNLIQLPQPIKRAALFEMSFDGKYIAMTDGFEEVFLMCTASRELLRVFKNNTKVVSMTFNSGCNLLYCYGVQGEVSVWDLSTFKPMSKFYDQGCVTASCITTSPCGRLLATGSGEGIVNIYESSKLTTTDPIPLKVIDNLVTKITNLKFNATSEILAAVSHDYPNAVKLVHIPSYHVFPNFPKQSSNLNNVGVVNFSPNSGYMALGNNKNFASLYRLKYYKNY
ncbi:hypothetical protein K1T71_005531 [Dendrolimus kikuchii]|uniref:Uncharacterized protein n=1 Tax=Dendrolimus kikuchii TaxID=765133 RepID=A0ACC1D461_9NEOP|nr:hypothetical protein K1T71_005531 [Dendrolimus kikuchii]